MAVPVLSRPLQRRRAGFNAACALLLSSCTGCEPVCVSAVGLGGSGTGFGSVSATLDLPTYETAERQDVLIDWSGLTSDMYCAPLDPVSDVDAVGLTRFPRLDQDEVASGLAFDTILQSDTNGYVSCEPGVETACRLSEFAFGGTAYDVLAVYEEAGGSFLLSISTGTQATYGGNRFMAFLAPLPESDVVEVMVEPYCPMATVNVDLDAGSPLEFSASGMGGDTAPPDSAECIEAVGPSWPINWSELAVSAVGTRLTPEDIDLVVVARYDLKITELEERFSDRDKIAAEWYSLTTDREVSADLADAKSATGLVSFSGFSGEGVWLLELRVDGSLLNLPAFVSVAESG